jgi:hypothetical protein
MAHYAYVVDGVVQNVLVVANPVITDENGVEQEALGQAFLANLYDLVAENFIQCSYNGNFRGVYPGVGYGYDSLADVFVAPEVSDEAS